MKIGIKAAAAAVAVIVAAVAVTAAGVKYVSQKELQSHLADVSAQISAVTAERNATKNSIERLEDEYNRTINDDTMSVTLFFDNITDNITRYVYPLLTRYGRVGTIVMKNGAVPGDELCASVEEISNLTSLGWDLALGGANGITPGDSDAPELFAAYLDSYISKLNERGIEAPHVFCFDNGEYDKRYAPILKARGFGLVRLSEEDDAPWYEDGLLFINSQRICTEESDVKEKMQHAYSSGGALAVHVRYIENIGDKTLDCDAQKYTYMLDYLKNSCKNASVLTANEMYLQKSAKYEVNRSYIEDCTARMDELNLKLSELDGKLEELYGSLE